MCSVYSCGCRRFGSRLCVVCTQIHNLKSERKQIQGIKLEGGGGVSYFLVHSLVTILVLFMKLFTKKSFCAPRKGGSVLAKHSDWEGRGSVP